MERDVPSKALLLLIYPKWIVNSNLGSLLAGTDGLLIYPKWIVNVDVELNINLRGKLLIYPKWIVN